MGEVGRCGRTSRRSWMQSTGFPGLAARDRVLGTGILAHEAVCSPGGSNLRAADDVVYHAVRSTAR